jgi:hypothetical protein
MKVVTLGRISLLALILLLSTIVTIQAQQAYEEYTGKLVGVKGSKAKTETFSLKITGMTPDSESKRNREVLRDKGQDKLLDLIKSSNLGTFSVGNQPAININVVRIAIINGKRRILVVFERLISAAEIQGGLLSVDYPFSVIELLIDDKTSKGEGTYIAFAQIRWDSNPMPINELEISNFGTYPAKLVKVQGKMMLQFRRKHSRV